MSELLVCWKCGVSLAALPLPLARGAECPTSCCADLHVCRMCRFYDPAVANACNELLAEPVLDKERANFCDYFQARPDAYTPDATEQAERARAALAALFGLGPDHAHRPSVPTTTTTDDPPRVALERLFST